MIDYDKAVAVTNRHLCCNDYFEQIKKIAYSGVKTIIVREKDLSECEYINLYKKVLEVCSVTDRKVLCIPHFYPKVCEEFPINMLHLPFEMFLEYAKAHNQAVSGLCQGNSHQADSRQTGSYQADSCQTGSCRISLGTSVHSFEEAVLAQKLGAAYITAGHIFETDCKKGAEPRGLDFLKNVCSSVNIPVYAIGGISQENYESALEAGAAKVCMMSQMMRM